MGFLSLQKKAYNHRDIEFLQQVAVAVRMKKNIQTVRVSTLEVLSRYP